MLDTPKVVRLEATPTIAVRLVRPMDGLDIGALFGEFMPKVASRAGALGASPASLAYARYHQFGPEICDMELGLTVERLPADLPPQADVPDGEVGGSELPGGPAVTVLHTGPYPGLSDAYDALRGWIAASTEFDMLAGPWELYLNMPGPDVDPSTLRTEVTWPLRTR
jgi:hypothetical protein